MEIHKKISSLCGIKRVGGRERERRQIERQTDRQREQIDRQRDRDRERQRETETERDTERERDRDRDRERQRETHTHTQTQRERERNKARFKSRYVLSIRTQCYITFLALPILTKFVTIVYEMRDKKKHFYLSQYLKYLHSHCGRQWLCKCCRL